MLRHVTSNFSRGKFTQDLNGVLIDPGAFFKSNSKATPNNTNPRETSQANAVNNNNKTGDLKPAPTPTWQPPYDFAVQSTPNLNNQAFNDDAVIQNENSRLLARVPPPDSTREPPTFP